LITLLNYTNYGDLGINTGLILEVPKLIGQGNIEEAERVQRQAYTATLVVSGLIALLVISIAFIPFHSGILQTASILIVASAVLVLALLNYYHVVARFQERFGLIGLSIVITAIVATAGVVILGINMQHLRVEIVALIILLGFAAGALLLGIVMRPSLAWSLNRVDLRRLIKIGLPISLLPIAFTLFQSIDRWVVAILVPTQALGYYGLGTTLGVFLYMLPNALAVVLFTRQIERFGATNDPKASEPLVSPPLLFSGYTMALLAGGVALAMPYIIHYLVPAYWLGMRAAIFQVTGNCLLFAVPVASTFLISIGQQRRVFGALAIGIIVEAGLVFVLVQTPWGIDGAALAVLISDAVYGGLVAFLALRLFGGTMRQQLCRVASCFIPFAICLPVSTFLLSVNAVNGTLWNDLSRLVVYGIVYLVICGLLYLLVAWMSGVLRHPSIVKYRNRLSPASIWILLKNQKQQ
jgi:O-antigen/teichoic acid export membrane protein